MTKYDDGIGQELTKGNAGFEIYHEFEPKTDEEIFDKAVISAFKESGLLEYIVSKDGKTTDNSYKLCGQKDMKNVSH